MTTTPNPVRAARLERGWTVEELARRADLSRPTVTSAERNRNNHYRRTRRSLSHALGVPQAVLWPDDERPVND